MPNPKWRHSKTRKRKRRTHYKAETPQLATCKTGAIHIMYHAHWHEGNLYYKGHVVIKAAEEATAEA